METIGAEEGEGIVEIGLRCAYNAHMSIRTPIEAIDYKSAATAYWHKMKQFSGLIPDVPNMADWQGDLHLINSSMPIVWPDRFAKIAMEGARQLTQQQVPSPAMLPPVEGHWHMWSSPIVNVMVEGQYTPIDSVIVSAVRYQPEKGRPGLAIRAFTQIDGIPMSVLWLNYWLDIPADVAYKEMLSVFPSTQDRVEAATIWFWVFTSEIFLSQRLFQTDAGHLERHARKRYQKAGISTEVQVVRLRTIERQNAAQSEAEAIEWTCRWMVRGHWTQQWYPSEGKHKTIWIMPYVKGPENKPFRAPLPPVGSVVR